MQATGSSDAGKVGTAQDVSLEKHLAGFEAFRNLLPGQLGRLAALATRTRFGPGDLVIEEGRPFDAVHCVIQGELQRFAIIQGDPIPIDIVGPGAVIPLPGLLGLPATASTTCMAITETETVNLKLNAMATLMADESDVRWRITQGAIAQISRESDLHVRDAAQSLRLVDTEQRRYAEGEAGPVQKRLLLSGQLTRLAYMVSESAHDVNNALTSVIGYTDLILAHDTVDGSTRRNLKIVLREAQRASQSTTGSLQFVRRLAYGRTSTCVNDAIAAVIALRHSHLSAQGIDLRLDLAADIPPVQASADQLCQMFLNLILNAERSVSPVRGHRVLKIASRSLGRHIEVTLEDNGPEASRATVESGTPELLLPLGLPEAGGLPDMEVCVMIAREHGGSMRVQSATNRGTVVTVELPVERPIVAP